MKKRTIVLFGMLLMVLTAVAGGKIKVACVGNSVTWGMTIIDREKNCYPAQLQKMLGNKYEVRNFGHSGTTLLQHGHRPYIDQQEYQEALNLRQTLSLSTLDSMIPTHETGLSTVKNLMLITSV